MDIFIDTAEAGYTDVVVLLNSEAMAVVGPPGWLKSIPDQIFWHVWIKGIKIYTQSGDLLGTAATDSKEDFMSHDRVNLLTFDGFSYEQHGSMPLIKK
jgi:hypothetical protein